MKRIAPLLLASLALLAAGCGSSNDTNTTPSAPASGNGPKVDMKNIAFDPKTTTVKVGQTVTWTNRDDIPHTVVCAGKFRSKTMDTDGTFSFTFAAPGEYKYFCSLHPHMTGMVKVE